MHLLDSLTWELLILACLTLGLAPFTPPHIVGKLQMLARGELKRPLDIFDFAMHGAPWLLLVAKAARVALS